MMKQLSRYFKYSFSSKKGATELLVALAWAYPLLFYVKAIVLRLPMGESLAGAVLPTIYFFLVLLSFGYLKNNYRISDFFFIIMLILLYVVHIAFYPENSEIITFYFPSLLLSLAPMFLIGIATDINEVYKPLYVMSILCVLLQAVNSLYVEAGERAAAGEVIKEHMNTAYRIMPYVIFCFWGWLRKFDFFGFIASIVGLFLLISYGSRGPVLCTFLFLVLYVLFFKAFKGKWVVIVVLGLIIVLYNLYFEQFMMFMQVLLSQFGLSTRVIDLFSDSDTLVYASGRDELTNVLMNKIQENPLLGYGIGGTWQFVGTYAHNFIIDFIISFGVLFGSIFLLAILSVYIKGFKACNTLEEKGFFLVLACCFFKLFMSYVFLDDYSWILLLGYCIGLIRRKKQHQAVLV